VRTTRRVRFEEVDALGIVWHGRYSSYLEDGRIAFGDRFHLGYLDMKRESVAAPIVQLHLDFFAPLYFDQTFEIETVLHWSESLRFNFSYRIFLGEKILAAGYTVQLLTDLSGNLLFIPPQFIADFRQRWQQGELLCNG